MSEPAEGEPFIKWPEPPFTSPRDALIAFYRNWGWILACVQADQMIGFLQNHNMTIQELEK